MAYNQKEASSPLHAFSVQAGGESNTAKRGKAAVIHPGYVHVDVKVIRRETAGAFQVILADNTIVWLPKTQIAGMLNFKAGDRDCTMPISEWIAQQKFGEKQ